MAAYRSLFFIVMFVGISLYSPVGAVECGGESDRECYVAVWQTISLYLIIALYAIAMAGVFQASCHYGEFQKQKVLFLAVFLTKPKTKCCANAAYTQSFATAMVR